MTLASYRRRKLAERVTQERAAQEAEAAKRAEGMARIFCDNNGVTTCTCCGAVVGFSSLHYDYHALKGDLV